MLGARITEDTNAALIRVFDDTTSDLWPVLVQTWARRSRFLFVQHVALLNRVFAQGQTCFPVWQLRCSGRAE